LSSVREPKVLILTPVKNAANFLNSYSNNLERLTYPREKLSLGIYDVANARPHPDPAGVEPRHLSKDGRTLRLWILVSDDDSEEAILARAEKHGAKILWRDHYWAEFNGFNGAFEDPWGNTIVCWTKGGPNPVIGEGKTSE